MFCVENHWNLEVYMCFIRVKCHMPTGKSAFKNVQKVIRSNEHKKTADSNMIPYN